MDETRLRRPLRARAFGVQFLGAGYTGRSPAVAPWTSEPAGKTGALLSHVNSAAWFAAPFVAHPPYPEPWMYDPDRTPPDVLTRARTELTDTLYSPGDLNAAGFPDLHD